MSDYIIPEEFKPWVRPCHYCDAPTHWAWNKDPKMAVCMKCYAIPENYKKLGGILNVVPHEVRVRYIRAKMARS